MLVCEWCLINVHHDVALHSARLLNNFDDLKKAYQYTGTKNINMANKPRGSCTATWPYNALHVMSRYNPLKNALT